MSGVGNGRLTILATLCVAMLLMILPMPDWARPFRPQWVTLVLLYWAIALPHRVGVGSGFATGIVLDVLTGTLLGQHALGLSIVTFIAILELLKEAVIEVVQAEEYTPLHVRAASSVRLVADNDAAEQESQG